MRNQYLGLAAGIGLAMTMGVQAGSPATEYRNYLWGGMAEQDGENAVRYGYERRPETGNVGFRVDVLDGREITSNVKYSRLHAGMTFPVRLARPTAHWNALEVGFRNDRFWVSGGGDTNENGWYAGTHYEDWPTGQFGYSLRLQYADEGNSAGADVRAEGLFALTANLQASVAYEVVDSGTVEEDIAEVLLRLTW